MNKAYSRINNGKGWENFPSDKTAVDEINLNHMEIGIDEIDNRVVILDETKATKLEVSELFRDVSLDLQSGIITFTRKNGATVVIDTPMEKIQTGIYYDPVTEMLTLPLIDGTTMGVDLSRLITEYEFLESDTIAFSVNVDGKVTAIIKEGSIQEKHLRPDYLADIRVEQGKAQLSAEKSEEFAKLSESYTHGGTGIREGEDTDNAMEYARQAKESADRASEVVSGNDLSKIIKLIGNENIENVSSTITGAINSLNNRTFKIIRLDGTESNINNVKDLPVFSIALTYDDVPVSGLPDNNGDKWFIITFGINDNWYVQMAFDTAGTKMSYRTSYVETPTVKYSAWIFMLGTKSDLKDNVVTFRSEDSKYPSGYEDVSLLRSGEEQSSLWRKTSLFFKNVRYLWKLCGSTDISGIGDGTLTGAVSKLNTDIVPGYISCSYSFCEQHGWYRIAKSEGAYSSNSCLISAKRFYNNMPPEYQRIQFFGVYTLRKFINISAASLMHAWTKIRETWDETNNVSYLEIYQNADSANMWLISIEDALSPEGNIQSWKTIPPVLTQETINGVTVLALSELPANNPA